MRILFVHQNFPGQYAHLLRYYAADPSNEIVFLTRNANAPFPGIRKIVYRLHREAGAGTHPYLRSMENAVLHGQAVARAAIELRDQGFVPDIVLGHNGWGETLYLKDIFPRTPLLACFEFFYSARGADVGFDPEFPVKLDSHARVRTLNAVNLLGLDAADRGQTATEWQHSRYPRRYRDLIAVAHEGIDTRRVRPDVNAVLALGDGPSFSRSDEIITYLARNLEPYRGFHVFMRALPEILRRRPRAHVLIVGGDGVSYGAMPANGRSWRQTMLEEVGAKLDPTRVHFLGRVPYGTYLKVLQISSAHVYLTYPFVLSWSMLEAMAAGCVVIGSTTPPVEEAIGDGENGLLVNFFDTEALADKVESVLAEPRRWEALRASARQSIVTKYDCASVCLPQHLRLIDELTGGSKRISAIASRGETQSLQIQLTSKEVEVLNWLRQGKSAWEVAQILGRSEHTVKNQIRALYGKLGARNRAQALQHASGLTAPHQAVA